MEKLVRLGNTPVTQHQFEGVTFYLKRDDLLHPQFSGNKARKLLSLIERPPEGIDTLIGFGSPQANSLYSLAALAHIQGWRLDFYVDHIADFLTSNPTGNFARATQLGANIIEVPNEWRECGQNTEQSVKSNLSLSDNQLFVEEGGRMPIAEYGLKALALEIVEWAQKSLQGGTTKRESPYNCDSLVVALPAGTGTTALYLHKHLCGHGIEVITTPCVGGSEYLQAQFKQLSDDSSIPTIWSSAKKHHFGKLYREDYEIWLALMAQCGVEFELLYDPLMWRVLLEKRGELHGKTLLYLHQGGLIGNESMLPRYQRKYPDA
jgi:1-aminocyclopropane-1-carboxylate deaminase/D-cysteine desulfhydrase-like pyridoxal-dependent ACC family enzyme